MAETLEVAKTETMESRCGDLAVVRISTQWRTESFFGEAVGGSRTEVKLEVVLSWS
jgi:hypothetical protein